MTRKRTRRSTATKFVIEAEALELSDSAGRARLLLALEPHRARDMAKVLRVASEHGDTLGLTEEQVSLAEGMFDAVCTHHDWLDDEIDAELPVVINIDVKMHKSVVGGVRT